MVFTGAFLKGFDVPVSDLYVGKLCPVLRKFLKALLSAAYRLLFLLLLCRGIISFLPVIPFHIDKRLFHCALQYPR